MQIKKEHTYRLLNYERSNQSMCLHQTPLVDLGDVVKAGDIIADGPATKSGDLALGEISYGIHALGRI